MLGRVGEETTLLSTIIKRKGNWIGLSLRKEGLLNEVVNRKVEALKQLGRRRMHIVDDLGEKGKYRKLKTEVQDQVTWKQKF